MKKTISLLLMGLIGMVGTYAFAGSDREETVDRMQKSVEVLQSIMSTPDKGIPEEVLNSAKCIVVVPNLLKGGFIFGGKHGRGVATCRTADGWSAPAFISVGGGSWGLQIGVEGVDLVMLVMNDRGLQHLLSTKFELTGEGSVAAGPVGRHTSAGTDILLNTEVLTYSRSKGVFAGLTLEGAVIEQDNDSRDLWSPHDVPQHSFGKGIHSRKRSCICEGCVRSRTPVSRCGSQRRQQAVVASEQ
jgi:lipid-binding SYLF domain-containing protein